MSIKKVDTSVVINGNVYPVKQYGLNITRPEPIDGDIDNDIFGCDYTTVLTTTDSKVVYDLLSLFEYSVFSNNNHINVVKVNNAYVINLEIDDMPESIHDYVSDKMVVFGSYADDVQIHECVKGYLHCIGYDDPEQVYENFMDTMDENDEEQEILECSLDFYVRILEYTEDRERVDAVLKEFINV